MDIQLKPEESETTIRIPTGVSCEVTATISISKERGISALYCGKVKKIRTYLFLKSKGWTMASAKRWVAEHKERRGVEMSKLYTKAFVEKTGDKDGMLQSAVITSEILDREGEVLKADGGVFDSFLKNPTLLWAHNVKETRPPIGRVTKIWKEGNAWKFTPQFDLKDKFAAEIYRKFKDGFLNAFSIGFLPLEQDGNTYNKWEALEFSAVPVPANAEATVQLRAKGFETAKWEDLTVKEKDTFKEDVVEALAKIHERVVRMEKAQKKNKIRRVEDDTSTKNVKDVALLLNKTTEKLLRELKKKGGEYNKH